MVDENNKIKKNVDGKLKGLFNSAVTASESIKNKTVDLTATTKDKVIHATDTTLETATKVTSTVKIKADELGISDKVNTGVSAANIVKDKVVNAADTTLETATKVTSTVKTKADELGISDKVNTGVSAAMKTVDVFTGEEQLRLIEERLTLQMRYNDVLATKLDEALSRIQVLEGKIERAS